VLLIDADGVKVGIIPIQDALRMAEEAGLDLVEVAETAKPPVCRIMDHGKMLYQARKKKTTSKAATGLKELSFSMKISAHDIETKMKQARQFLEKGHKLKFNLILRGRERAYADTNGVAQLRRLVQPGVDHCAARVTQCAGHHARAAVVAVQPRLGYHHAAGCCSSRHARDCNTGGRPAGYYSAAV
jgi:translation initiation factor IF-3